MSTRVPLSAVALAVVSLCQGAYAQGAADSTLDPVAVEAPATPFRQLLGVEVTGTAIINPKARERLPLTVIERRDIERSGATTLLQVLEGLSIAHSSTDEGQMITATGGAIAVGLRGEPNSTLVLLNGVRLPNYAQYSLSGEASSAHLRLIPLIAVERIEVLREGASTLYGSDAVAGVVNIITRTDVQGVNIRARQGLVAGGLGNQDNLELSWGKGRFERDGYQVLAAVGLNRGRALLGADRPRAWWPGSEI
jgi:iron complex outermembrane receptor protein